MKMHALFLIGLLSTPTAFGHGEDKPGPRGGFIRMPGAFHIEVVPTGPSEAKVYLLDMEWKNPSTKDVSVEMSLKGKGSANCSVKKDHVLCVLQKGANLQNKGQLVVKAKREGQVGNEVTYDLPLKLTPIDDGHEGNH